MHIQGSIILDTYGDISLFDFFQLKTESEDPDSGTQLLTLYEAINLFVYKSGGGRNKRQVTINLF